MRQNHQVMFAKHRSRVVRYISISYFISHNYWQQLRVRFWRKSSKCPGCPHWTYHQRLYYDGANFGSGLVVFICNMLCSPQTFARTPSRLRFRFLRLCTAFNMMWRPQAPPSLPRILFLRLYKLPLKWISWPPWTHHQKLYIQQRDNSGSGLAMTNFYIMMCSHQTHPKAPSRLRLRFLRLCAPFNMMRSPQSPPNRLRIRFTRMCTRGEKGVVWPH